MKKTCLIMLILTLIISILGCVNPRIENAIDSSNEMKQLSNEFVSEITYDNYIMTNNAEFAIIEGTLYGRGNNDLRIFGTDPTLFFDSWFKIAENILHIQANGTNVIYLTNSGEVYGLGRIESGVLQESGNGFSQISKILISDCKFISLGINFVLAIKNDNTLWFWGESKHGQGCEIRDEICDPIKIADNVRFAKAFGYTSAWIDNYNNLYLCGDNSFNQIGNGIQGSGTPEVYLDIVSKPYCALKNCHSFSVSDDMVISAKTIAGDDYIWGNYHNAIPTVKSEEILGEVENIELSGIITLQNDNYILSRKDYLFVFYAENDDKNNRSIISAKYTLDNKGKKIIIKSGLAPAFTMSLLGNALTISSLSDDSVYLITYDEVQEGVIGNVRTSLLYEHYAIPVYILDSNHIVLALAQSYRELVLNISTGEVQEGEYWDYSKFDNKPQIDHDNAISIALAELKKEKYRQFDGDLHNYYEIEDASLVFQPTFESVWLNSWISPNVLANKENISWCWHVRISTEKDSSDVMDLYIDSNSGQVYSVVNTSS